MSEHDVVVPHSLVQIIADQLSQEHESMVHTLRARGLRVVRAEGWDDPMTRIDPEQAEALALAIRLAVQNTMGTQNEHLARIEGALFQQGVLAFVEVEDAEI